jgi:hypothetical protein
MSDKRKEFFNLNEEYQKCLNNFYDKFLDGEEVQLENLCDDILKKMKETGNFYKNMRGELEKHMKETK